MPLPPDLRSLLGRKRSYIPHDPFAQQAQFLALEGLEALYGGAAGGGKSDALLMAALQYVHVPGYAALILRRTYQQLALPNAIMARADDWLAGTDAHWDGETKCWTFPSGATLTFGYLDTERDKYRYQGAELQFIGFDELTQFPEAWYRYLLSRLRRLVGATVPVRARATSNPGDIGHEWVKRRFVDATTRGDRVFVPATMDDNPHLDRDEYRKSLAELDSTTRMQLEKGVWVRDGAGLIYKLDDTANLVEKLPERDDWSYGLAHDYGFTDETAWSVHAWARHNPVSYIARSFKESDVTPSEAALVSKRLDEEYGGFAWMVGDVGGLGKGYTEEARKHFRLPIRPAQKNDKFGYIKLFNGALEDGRLKIVAPECPGLVTEMRELPWNKEQTKEAEGFANHECDAALYGWREGRGWAAKELPPKILPGTPEHAAEQEKAMERAFAGKVKDRKLPIWERDRRNFGR